MQINFCRLLVQNPVLVSLVPVSYTHLDVYKRQILLRLVEIILSLLKQLIVFLKQINPMELRLKRLQKIPVLDLKLLLLLFVQNRDLPLMRNMMLVLPIIRKMLPKMLLSLLLMQILRQLVQKMLLTLFDIMENKFKLKEKSMLVQAVLLPHLVLSLIHIQMCIRDRFCTL